MTCPVLLLRGSAVPETGPRLGGGGGVILGVRPGLSARIPPPPQGPRDVAIRGTFSAVWQSSGQAVDWEERLLGPSGGAPPPPLVIAPEKPQINTAPVPTAA